jgi:hypothetical protein
MKMDIETIRKAVTKHHGGFKEANDAQIMTLWESLDEPTKEKYLKKVTPKSERKSKDATGS